MDIFNREELKKSIKKSVKRFYEAQIIESDLYRNTIDCFSAAIDSVVQEIDLEEWLKQEKIRQVQKTKQNAIGSLHEDIMGSIDGIVKLPQGKGNLIDIRSDHLKIVAEVKNKHNTTKGNHKFRIYQDLAQAINKYPGYIGYYVEILPKSRKVYNIPFTPPDNQTKQCLPERDDIRVIDGKSFYALLTGNDNAILELYSELPILVAEIIKEEFKVNLNSKDVISSSLFKHNFVMAYGENAFKLKKLSNSGSSNISMSSKP